MSTTHILGGYQTDFARNFLREQKDISDLCRETVTETLGATEIEPEQIESIHVGNAFGQLYTGQGHLGALPATVVPELSGVPAMRHEAACASGSLALLSAMREIESGCYDCVLVLGIELEKTMPSMRAAQVQAAAAYVGHEDEQSGLVWPAMFARVADAYAERYGLEDQDLRDIGALFLRNAKQNPNAQTRDWTLTDAHFSTDDAVNPVLAGRLRRNDCCPLTDGGAGVVVVSERFLQRNARRAGAHVAGWGHTTVGLPLGDKLARAGTSGAGGAAGGYLMPHVHRAIVEAQRRAGLDVGRSGLRLGDGLPSPGQSYALDVIETHDCLTPSAYMAIDHFGLTPPGESGRALAEGIIQRDGSLPMNPSGGLMGGGHPVGATGVRMVLDGYKQVTGQAGAYQVAGAKRVQTLNIGGSTATTVSFVVEGGTV